MKLECAGKSFDFSKRTHIMGIINCTPDSFYSESRRTTVSAACETALAMVDAGADFLDIGGESSRPGSEPVSLSEELERVIPVLESVSKQVEVPVSIDTYKAEVARCALDAGADIVNDISALQFDPEMAEVVASHNVPVVLMHIKGKPKEMQEDPHYDDVVQEVYAYLKERIAFAEKKGVAKTKIIIDPGIGFGKRVNDNYQIVRDLSKFSSFGCPILVGLSRKSFLQKVLGLPAHESIEGTIAMNACAISNGAHILRVHDVKEAKRCALVVDHYLRIRETFS